MRGIFEYELEGKKVGFKFGVYSLEKACELGNCSLSELYKRLGWTGDNTESDLKTSIDFFYAAAIFYAEVKRIDIDFNRAIVSDWIDQIGLDESANMIKESLRVPETKKKQM